VLKGGGGFVIGRLQFGGGCVGLRGFAAEEAVGEGSADVLVKENEEEGDAHAFLAETVSVALTVALE